MGMSDDRNGNQVGMPWWVNAIGVVGVTAAIALYLVYWLTNTLAVSLMQTQGMVSQQLTTTAAIFRMVQDSQTTATQVANALQGFQHQQNSYQLQTCINTAKSQYQVSKCADVAGSPPPRSLNAGIASEH